MVPLLQYLRLHVQNLLQNITLCYLVVLMSVKMLAMPFVLLSFEVNQKYVAEKYCVNKSNAAMNCSGKCHLGKQLNRSSDTQDHHNSSNGFVTSFDYCQEIPLISLVDNDGGILKDFQIYPDQHLPSGQSAAVFRPPIA